MLAVAATIPDAAARDQFADRLAHKARVTEASSGTRFGRRRSNGAGRRPAVAVPTNVRLRPAEQGLLWALVHRPVEGLAAVAQLEDRPTWRDCCRRPMLRLAASLADVPPEFVAGTAPRASK